MAKLAFIVIGILILVLLAPLATIWALNTLFPALNIPVTFDTWCAAVILGGLVQARFTSRG